MNRPLLTSACTSAALALAACASPESTPAEAPPPAAALASVQQAEYDCSTHTDTGYVRGDAFQIVLVTVDGHPVERDTANAYIVMQSAAANDGVGIDIVDGFRTMDEQQYYWDCFQNCNCNNCNEAAQPGFSNHQSGHALDLNTSAGGVLDWLNAHGGDYGFARTVASEDWHWEWWGGGPGGGPCVDTPCPTIPAAGDTLDDAGPCFRANGSAQYWRTVSGEGYNGGLHWTNAYVSDQPDNWSRFILNFEAAGAYQVEVMTGGNYGVWTRARYGISHGGVSETITIDQAAVSGWQSLGVFDFAGGGDQALDLFDNYDGDVPADQHLVSDAVRVTAYVGPPPMPDAAPAPATPDGGVKGDDAGPDADALGDAGPATDGGADETDFLRPSPGGSRLDAGGAPVWGANDQGVSVTDAETKAPAAFHGSAGCQQMPAGSPQQRGAAVLAVMTTLGLGARRRRR